MAERKLRILCFGDSLTEGYTSFGAIYQPYSERMTQKLAAAFPDVKIECEVDGLSGDLTGFFLKRLLEQCEPFQPPVPCFLFANRSCASSGWEPALRLDDRPRRDEVRVAPRKQKPLPRRRLPYLAVT